MRDADQLIAGALRDIAAEAGPPRPLADAAWRAGRRRRLAAPVASAAFIAGVIALALTVAIPQASAPGPAAPHTRLVSITLSPGPAAGTGALAQAAQLLRQRATYLRLPDIQIQVFGPDVVVTGPAADQAQLKTIAMPGVLNFRQVLLYQAYRGPTYGDASLVSGQTLALFRRLACTPGNTSTWKNQVGYAVAQDYDNPYVQVVACDSSGNKYALDVAMVHGTQLTSAAAAPSPTSGRWTVLLTLNRAGASAFAALTSQLYGTYFAAAQAGHQNDLWLDSVAIVVDGNVVSAPAIAVPVTGGHLQLPGVFTQAQAEELAAQLHFGAMGEDFQITAVTTPSASS
ncbi:MAG: SecDF P1 head subdomain-containing protein, partial [Streptosporangiaceae bacterium]